MRQSYQSRPQNSSTCSYWPVLTRPNVFWCSTFAGDMKRCGAQEFTTLVIIFTVEHGHSRQNNESPDIARRNARMGGAGEESCRSFPLPCPASADESMCHNFYPTALSLAVQFFWPYFLCSLCPVRLGCYAVVALRGDARLTVALDSLK